MPSKARLGLPSPSPPRIFTLTITNLAAPWKTGAFSAA
jgi:hypothetical protein